MIEQFKPKPIDPFPQPDKYDRERKAIRACLQTVGIYGEDAMLAEACTMKRLGIVCDGSKCLD